AGDEEMVEADRRDRGHWGLLVTFMLGFATPCSQNQSGFFLLGWSLTFGYFSPGPRVPFWMAPASHAKAACCISWLKTWGTCQSRVSRRCSACCDAQILCILP